MLKEALIDKKSFIGLEECTWLYSGAETPPHKGCLEAVNEYMHDRGKGPAGRERNEQIERSCKENVAHLLHGQAQDIAIVSNTSEAISMIAQSLDLRKGDNVIINTLEFPSGVLPWLLLKEKGVEIRVVDHEQWQITAEAILQQVDENTRLVVTSHVSYLTGARIDYKRLYSSLKKTNALLLLDVTQSLGVIPVDMNESDFVVCSSYKWLLSIHGAGILGINTKRLSDFKPKSVGWRSVEEMFSSSRFDTFTFKEDARRFERGFPSYPAIYTLHFSTHLLLHIGIEKIEKHILELGRQLIQGLTTLGYEVMTPADPKQRAGNICILSQKGEHIAALLQQQGVYLWGGDGRFRASIHLFNDLEDINKLLHLLPMLNQ